MVKPWPRRSAELSSDGIWSAHHVKAALKPRFYVPSKDEKNSPACSVGAEAANVQWFRDTGPGGSCQLVSYQPPNSQQQPRVRAPTLQRWAQGLRVHLCPVTPWINASGNVKGPVILAPGKCLLWSLPVNSGVRHAAVEGCTSQPVTGPFLTETLQIVMIITLHDHPLQRRQQAFQDGIFVPK